MIRRNTAIATLALAAAFPAMTTRADGCIVSGSTVRDPVSSGSAVLGIGFFAGYDWLMNRAWDILDTEFRSDRAGFVINIK